MWEMFKCTLKMCIWSSGGNTGPNELYIVSIVLDIHFEAKERIKGGIEGEAQEGSLRARTSYS